MPWREKIKRITSFGSNAYNGQERLRKVWWLCGIPLGLAVSALVIAAEELRYDDLHGWGNFLDAVPFVFYFAWFRLAWRCSGNVDLPMWTLLSRAGLSLGLVFMAFL